MPMDKNERMRRLPSVDDLMRTERARALCGIYGRAAVLEGVRGALDSLRSALLAEDGPGSEGACAASGTDAVSGTDGASVPDAVLTLAEEAARQGGKSGLRPVVNATGVVLHTNLGRAVLPAKAVRAVVETARGYSSLEYDLETGARGSRCQHVEALLREITGAESAIAVNNNAAAVYLALSALARGGEVVVSRGELVEIGGAFRVPEIMEESGAVLREVGTTNKTHPADYRRALGEQTAAILKVHASNYRIVGFTAEVSLPELCALGGEAGLPVLYDMGSGALYPLDDLGLPGEPDVRSAVAAGADVVCFSGDKLLGGPQAGLILGKKALIDRMKTHPLARALRLDKLTLAALEATLRLYRDPAAARAEIPTLRMLGQGEKRLEARARALLKKLGAAGVAARVSADVSEVGGGSAPGARLPTCAVEVTDARMPPDALAAALRRGDTPVVGRVGRGCFIMDMTTVEDGQLDALCGAVRAAFGAKEGAR